ncbi:MAG TPA: type II toxin-antitoxin system RelE/ParE family toxin [Bacteroidia bacterium]|nr:type II toxin-antitoxin system RelE/ParE family toxin [Bacteroidia bacterium]
MALSITWTEEAERTFAVIIKYLLEHWTEKEVRHFISETNRVIAHITVTPRMFRRSARKNIHEGLITRHCLLIYRVRKNKIELLSFFDTRQNPKKKQLIEGRSG